MTYAHLAYLFFCNFAFIFLKALQQRNVSGAHYVAIVPTSLLLALAEVYIIVQVATTGLTIPVVLALGVAGGVGSLAAVWSHKRIFK